MTKTTDGRAPGIAVFVSVAWFAAVIAVAGIISLVTDTEVAPLAGGGTFVWPLAVGAAFVALFARLAVGTAPLRGRAWLLPVESVLLVWAALVLGGAVAFAAARGEPVDALLYVGAAALSPYTLAAVLLAAAAALVHLLVVRARAAGAGSPRWPWERHDE